MVINTKKLTSLKQKFSEIDKFKCPMIYSDIMTDGIKFINQANRGDGSIHIDQNLLVDILGWNAMMHTPFKLVREEIIDAYRNISTSWKLKEDIITDGKNILAVIGESHHTQYSYLFEMIIMYYCDKVGIKKLFVEYSPQEYEKIFNNKEIVSVNQFSASYFAKEVLGWQLIPIDHSNKHNLKNYPNLNEASKIREEAMIDNILLNNNVSAVAVVGSHHLEGIVQSQKIKDSFLLLPVDVSIPNHMRDDLFSHGYTVDALKDVELEGKDSINLQFTTSIESMSKVQAFDIFEENIPYFDETPVVYDNIKKMYTSDFLEDPSQCYDQSYSLLINAAKTIWNHINHDEL